MKPLKLLVVVLGLLSVAATLPVAMRVETEPLRALGGETVVTVIVQIAPEDRSRIGRDAWLELELRSGKTMVNRLAQAVAVSGGGEARLEVAWAPGTYELRATLEAGSGDDSGLWIGKVTVPRLEELPPPTPAPEPTPAVFDEAAAAAAGAAAAAAAAPEPPSASAGSTGAAPTVADPPGETAEVGPTTEASAAEPPVDSAADSEIAVGEPVEKQALTQSPEPVAPVAAAAAGAVATAPARIDRDLAEFTLMVIDRNRPVPGLDERVMTLRVNGSQTPIEDVAGATAAPLLLGIGLDMSASMGDYLSTVNQLVGKLSLRAHGGRGQFFLATADTDAEIALDWGATPAQLGAVMSRTGSAEAGDLAGLVSLSLGQFEGRNGRKFLFVISDGGDIATKEDWASVMDTVDAAGVTILSIGVREGAIDSRTRKNLRRMSLQTGGKDYFVSDTGPLQLAMEHLSDLIEASYVLRFRRPGAGKGGLHKIQLEVVDRGYEVFYPKTVR